MKTITWLSPQDAPEWFPPLEQALEEPAGLLAAGGTEVGIGDVVR